ncbi:MAG: hypothetical protein ACI4E0_04660 [Blautia sp.]
MSDKALLVMDMPKKGCISCVIGRNQSNLLETCIYCPLACRNAIDKEAEIQPDWCPLKPVPKKKLVVLDALDSFGNGWNTCIDEITGGMGD